MKREGQKVVRRRWRHRSVVVLLMALCSHVWGSTGRVPHSVHSAEYRAHLSRNFLVEAAGEPVFSREVAQVAETALEHHARYWKGRSFPTLFSPIPLRVNPGLLPSGGTTSFRFLHGEVFQWRMQVQGTPANLLSNIIPHEVSHVAMALLFRRQLPRWADEGVATLMESDAAKQLQLQRLKRLWQGGREGMSFHTLIHSTEYPRDKSLIIELYAKGMTLADFLLRYGERENGQALETASYSESNRRRFLALLRDGPRFGWNATFTQHYGLGLNQMERAWRRYVSTYLFAERSPNRPLAATETEKGADAATPPPKLQPHFLVRNGKPADVATAVRAWRQLHIWLPGATRDACTNPDQPCEIVFEREGTGNVVAVGEDSYRINVGYHTATSRIPALKWYLAEAYLRNEFVLPRYFRHALAELFTCTEEGKSERLGKTWRLGIAARAIEQSRIDLTELSAIVDSRDAIEQHVTLAFAAYLLSLEKSTKIAQTLESVEGSANSLRDALVKGSSEENLLREFKTWLKRYLPTSASSSKDTSDLRQLLDPLDSAPGVYEMKDKHWESVRSASLPVLIYVATDWCAPCQKLKPRFLKLANRYRNEALFVIVNPDENREFAKRFQVRIVPALVVIKDREIREFKPLNEQAFDSRSPYF